MLAVLQFDSVSLSLLGRLLDQGRLPTMARLAGAGVWHELATPATHFAAGAQHTLYSGVELADHGLFYPFQWCAADQRVRYMTDIEAPPPVWEPLGRAGIRVVAIDPYESRPARRPPPGTVACGWQLTDRVVLPAWSSPPGARDHLEALFGPAEPVEEVFGRHAVRDQLDLRRRLLGAPRRVAEAAELLLGAGDDDPADIAWFTFVAPHVAGHQFWDLSQLEGDDLDQDARRVLGGTLAEVYEATDAAISRVLDALPEDADVMVVSPVGMDVNNSRADMLGDMLDAVLSGERRGAGTASSIWRLRAALPTGLRARVADALPDRVALELTARLELRGVDWSATRAFAHPGENQGYVRLNLAGRERDGLVAPADADALLDEITAGLASFRDPDGEPAVARIDRVAEVFGPGERTHQLPDLVVTWNDRSATALDGLVSDRFGPVDRRGWASGRSGNHTPGDAWTLVVPGSASPRRPSRPARLVDVAATVVAMVGGDADLTAGEPLLEAG